MASLPSTQPELALLVGVQASGKTSFYRERYLLTHVRVSLDLLRTRARVDRFLSLCLDTRMSLVSDNTNPNRAEREPLIARAKAAGFLVTGFYFHSRIQECLDRNALRDADARIPEAGVRSCASRMEIPSALEGYDRLSYVRLLSGSGFSIEEWNDGIR